MGYNPRDVGLEVARDYPNYALVHCPFHHDVHPSAVFSKVTGHFRCYSCTASKNFVDFDEVQVGVDPKSTPVFLPDLTVEDFSARMFDPAGLVVEAQDYLERRGVSFGTAHRYGVLWDGVSKTVVFPVRDQHGLSGVVHRRVDGESPRYIKIGVVDGVWPGIGFRDSQFQPSPEPLYVSEGPFKAMRLHQAGDGVPSVCTFGARMGRFAAELLSQWPGQLVLVADGDDAGLSFAARFRETFPRARVFVPKTPFDELDADAAARVFARIQAKVREGRLL